MLIKMAEIRTVRSHGVELTVENDCPSIKSCSSNPKDDNIRQYIRGRVCGTDVMFLLVLQVVPTELLLMHDPMVPQL
jgi:hypothetical protein